MKTAAVVLLVFACLAVVAIEGLPGIGSQRCLCLGSGLKKVNPLLVQKIEIHPASPSCGRLEVIVVMKNGAVKRCLDPQSAFNKNLINKLTKKTRSAQ